MAVTEEPRAPGSAGVPSGPTRPRKTLRSLRPGLRGFVRVMRANPLTLLGFAMVVVIFVLALLITILPMVGQALLGRPLSILSTWWPYYVRLVRGEVLVVKQQPYIVAAKAAGVSDVRIVLRHVIRNITEPVLVYFTLDVGTVIVTFSTISFIGVGVKLGVLEWGNMVEGYQTYLTSYPWMVLSAGAAIFLTVLAFGLLGDGLRDVLDPRSRKALAQTAVPTTLAAAAVPVEA